MKKAASRLAQLAGEVRQLEDMLSRAGAPVPRLDLKLPVNEHAKMLRASKTTYVLAAPLEDESEVRTLKAYANRKPVTLDPKTPPDVPTLVLIPGETESLDPEYPLEISNAAGDEQNARRVDDFVGIAKIRITNDHESWASGKPEIYAVIARNQVGGSATITPVDLPGVNNEKTWHLLGDPNATYLAHNTLNLPTTIDIWEEDNFAHGADDFLGRVTIDWTTLNFSGYTIFSSGDMSIQIDRD